MLSIKDLHKNFCSVIAVDGVTLEIAPGEIFSLIGPNSSGKTTIIKSIVGMVSVDEGEIVVDGMSVSVNPRETKQVIGYIPDEPSVWSNMTGEEFLHIVGALYGMKKEHRTQRIKELLPVFALDGIEKETFEYYSRGNKQKFSILAALLHKPKLLLVDEPIVGLDPESARIAKGLFRKFAAEGGAVLLVTHTLSVADEIADHIGVLAKGKLVAMGNPKSLREKAKVALNATLDDVYAALTQ